MVVAGSQGRVAAIDFAAASRVACVTDPAENAQLTRVAPGQLISILGTDLAPAAPFTPPGGVAGSTASLGVFFNGGAAPVLYTSAQQINVQVPFELAGAGTVQMQVVSQNTAGSAPETRTLAVVDRQPALFLSRAALDSQIPGYSTCGGKVVVGEAAVAFNADETVNDCANPAEAGSAVTVLLGGFGVTTPSMATGTIVAGPPVPLAPSLDPGPFTGTQTMATESLPGTISGVAQVQLRGGALQQLLIDPALGGVPLRERVIVIWTR